MLLHVLLQIMFPSQASGNSDQKVVAYSMGDAGNLEFWGNRIKKFNLKKFLQKLIIFEGSRII